MFPSDIFVIERESKFHIQQQEGTFNAVEDDPTISSRRISDIYQITDMVCLKKSSYYITVYIHFICKMVIFALTIQFWNWINENRRLTEIYYATMMIIIIFAMNTDGPGIKILILCIKSLIKRLEYFSTESLLQNLLEDKPLNLDVFTM